MTEDNTKPAAKKKPAKKKPAAKPKKKGVLLPKEIGDEYEAGVIEKFDVRGPTIVWVYTATLFDVWKKRPTGWAKTQSGPRNSHTR